MTAFSTIGSGYRVIAADPPWAFKSNSAAKPGRNAMRHYDCMSLPEINALPVGDIAAPNAVLFLWITGPFMAIGAHLPLMKAWGFKPSGMGFVWIKLNPKAASLFILETDLAMGGGFTTRKNAEFCLIGKRGAMCGRTRESTKSSSSRAASIPASRRSSIRAQRLIPKGLASKCSRANLAPAGMRGAWKLGSSIKHKQHRRGEWQTKSRKGRAPVTIPS